MRTTLQIHRRLTLSSQVWGGRGEEALWSLFYEFTNPICKGCNLMTSFNSNVPKVPPPKCDITWDMRIQQVNFGVLPYGPVVKTSLPMQGCAGLIPGQGTKIPHAMGCGPPKKCKKEWYLFLKNGFWGQHNHSVHSKGWFRNEYSIEKWWLHLLVMEKNPITQFLPQIYASPYKYVCRRRYFIWGKHPKGKRWWSSGLLCGSSVSRARTLSNP